MDLTNPYTINPGSNQLAIIAIITALALHNGVIPPTINLDSPDPECDLDYCANQAVEQKLEYALSNSFGFGGHNVTLCLRARR